MMAAATRYNGMRHGAVILACWMPIFAASCVPPADGAGLKSHSEALPRAVSVARMGAPAALNRRHWLKGSTHVHSYFSEDGNTSPAQIADWYHDHGYDFVVLTDHNQMTPPPETAPGFLMVHGEELSLYADVRRRGRKPIHLNALGVHQTIPAVTGHGGYAESMIYGFAVIRAHGGIAQLNHPTYYHAVLPEFLDGLSGVFLFEVYNDHPRVREWNETTPVATTAMWDRMLTAGKTVWGVAVDDAHDFRRFAPNHANPGGGFVMVDAVDLTESALLEALYLGRFYASNGPVLEDFDAGRRSFTVTVKSPAGNPAGDPYTIRFIGATGAHLAEFTGYEATYTYTGEEDYVRAEVYDGHGGMAWLQPCRVSAQDVRLAAAGHAVEIGP